MSKKIITEIENRDAFLTLLQHNPGLIILKLGAQWCGPCKTIKPVVDGFFASSPHTVVCADIDIDKCTDLYSLLKARKMVNGIPVLLCYKKGNTSYIPDDIVTGSDPQQLHLFFTRCGNHLMDVSTKHAIKMF